MILVTLFYASLASVFSATGRVATNRRAVNRMRLGNVQKVAFLPNKRTVSMKIAALSENTINTLDRLDLLATPETPEFEEDKPEPENPYLTHYSAQQQKLITRIVTRSELLAEKMSGIPSVAQAIQFHLEIKKNRDYQVTPLIVASAFRLILVCRANINSQSDPDFIRFFYDLSQQLQTFLSSSEENVAIIGDNYIFGDSTFTNVYIMDKEAFMNFKQVQEETRIANEKEMKRQELNASRNVFNLFKFWIKDE